MKNYLTQFSAPYRLVNAIRNIILKLKFPKLLIGRDSHLTHVQFEKFVSLGTSVQLNKTSVGRHSYISSNSLIRNATIGKFCSIGPYVKIGLGKHPTQDFISTHPIFYSLKKQSGKTFATTQNYDEELNVIVGNDIWIGAGAVIMDGVKIGNGAIIAAGAVVVNDVSPYEIVGGVPAKTIRFRFAPDEIEKIQATKWWDKDDEWLNKNAVNFRNKTDFLEFLCV